ncbi:Transposable element Tc1 transposase [Choanephora cucurbitarum]|uniref:Transposable element Tc1 transposase n=1 Tax=Choanephora cucurbitarum TaxID=101091 RepID=A0A1C7MUM6_9FUNG|nr:Transposable element Tc1 transposase [Choanephora cucurbitarum]
MDSNLHIEILDDKLIKTLDYYGYSEDTHLEDCGIEVVDLPAYSLDLNPIENLRGVLKRRLAGYSTPPDSIYELFARVTEVWNNIEPTICEKLTESMPDRVQQVIDANGGQIDY